MIVINIIGVTLLFIFLVFVLTKNQKVNSDYLLTLILLLLISYLIANIWVSADLNIWSFLFQVITAASLFFPFLIYALILIQKDHEFKTKWWLFAVFDTVYLSYVLIDILIFDRLSTITIAELYTNPPIVYFLFYKAHGVYKISVLVWFLFRLNKYQLRLQDYYSNLQPVSLEWLKYFVWVYIGENTISSLLFLSFDLGFTKEVETPYLITNTVLVLSLFYLIYNGIRQYTLANFEDPINNSTVSSSSEKYQTSSLTMEEMKLLFERIKNLFSDDAIYLDAELKVQDLARHLNVTSHNISQTINVKAEKSFYEFVNAYRIEHFQKLLTDSKNNHLTILGLGLESGFNSKASLNRIFKQQIGITPKEYQKQNSSGD